ncbi:hypothetical protein [Aestuariibaculum suncheonense]|uniref:DNA breaking-rejoining protein n=1 Tax=Aestuariibaculum suncheonense TaxID=1028745 RepID=A0A8J6UB75_9FLAO|nr:hypothetical protein [Aestuariibaculum suncheonense]MBD0835635.1 hypothetical protein [Aestuariibaculum suncheonense]
MKDKDLRLVIVFMIFPIFFYGQIINKKISFDSGKTRVVIEDDIKGEEIIDYAVNVKKGDSVSIILKRKINSSYFNLLPPKSDNVADFIGQTQGDTCKMTLSQNGIYKIRVYQMRSSARRGTHVKFSLDISLFTTIGIDSEKKTITNKY